MFENGKKILFGEIEDLSNFSFMDTDMSRVRLSDRARWGKDDKFKVTDEEKLQNPNKYFLFSRDEIRTNKKNCGNLLKYFDDNGKTILGRREKCIRSYSFQFWVIILSSFIKSNYTLP